LTCLTSLSYSHSSTHGYAVPPDLPSFPTRRSSDLSVHSTVNRAPPASVVACTVPTRFFCTSTPVDRYPSTSPTTNRAFRPEVSGDRKSTRLNSSHVKISYAVFCLKKKKKNKRRR